MLADTFAKHSGIFFFCLGGGSQCRRAHSTSEQFYIAAKWKTLSEGKPGTLELALLLLCLKTTTMMKKCFMDFMRTGLLFTDAL